MGSRIVIDLSEIVNNPLLEVTLSRQQVLNIDAVETADQEHPEYEAVAIVTFPQIRYSFDWNMYKGVIQLSADFNFFRYSADSAQLLLLRALYENSVCFTINH